MKQQQEAALLSAFQVMDDMDRHMLLAQAQAHAIEAVNERPRHHVAMAKTDATASQVPNVKFVDMNFYEHRKLKRLGENEIARERLGMCGDFYRGTAAALIASGLIEEHMLPGQPNRNKTTVTIKSTDGRTYGAGYLQISKIGPRHFQVKKGLSEDEFDCRRQAQNEAARCVIKKPFLRVILGGRQN